MRWKRETWNPNNVLRGCRKKKRREAQRERTEAWLRESPRHETTLFCFDRSSQPRPRREEEEKKRKWNEEGEKERNKARVKWSKKLTPKLKCNVVTKKRMGGSERKKKWVCVAALERRNASPYNTTQHNTTTVHHCLQKKKKKKKCSNKTTMQMQIIFSTSILYLKHWLYTFHVSFFIHFISHSSVRYGTLILSLFTAVCPFHLTIPLPRFSCPFLDYHHFFSLLFPTFFLIFGLSQTNTTLCVLHTNLN